MASFRSLRVRDKPEPETSTRGVSGSEWTAGRCRARRGAPLAFVATTRGGCGGPAARAAPAADRGAGVATALIRREPRWVAALARGGRASGVARLHADVGCGQPSLAALGGADDMGRTRLDAAALAGGHLRIALRSTRRRGRCALLSRLVGGDNRSGLAGYAGLGDRAGGGRRSLL